LADKPKERYVARNPFRRYFRHGLLPQLIAFEACVRLGGVTRAAEALALAQPTVSGLLRKLSETAGGPVLDTRAKPVKLTEAGQEVMLLCRDVLEALNRFEERRSENLRAQTTTMAQWRHAPVPPSPSKSPPAFPPS
jgi:DNA-binding transcriptional LysR family regulator